MLISAAKPVAIMQFRYYFPRCYPHKVLGNAGCRLKRLARKALLLQEPYYYRDKLIFKIERGIITKVIMIPYLTSHARLRLRQRFSVDLRDNPHYVMLDFIHAIQLNPEEKFFYEIGITKLAMRRYNRIYVLDNDYNVVTVLDSRLSRPLYKPGIIYALTGGTASMQTPQSP